ncbi:hypothetical protein SAMN05444413_1022 [Roseivivax marinus]|uniref:hypothetical protein n=1 Tax=Roseivivax marinus TaxID=1379903 RepID=UPI0008B9DADC|nr:hypothetical protein [Roseivivax marinus]SEK48301.1 hypothetical protein SAMN05444413_1022 [Roseivivax marinus]
MSNHSTPPRLPRSLRAGPPTDFHRFIEERLPALAKATRVLAGEPGTRLFNRILGDLAEEDHLRPSTLRNAEVLFGLLDPLGASWRELMNRSEVDSAAPEVLELECLVHDFREALALATTDHSPASRYRQRV